MYQNGKQLNRYAAKCKHQDDLKRKFLVVSHHSSLDRLAQSVEQFHVCNVYGRHYWEHLMNEKEHGNKPWFDCWWHAYDNYYGKRNWKHFSNSERRRAGRRYIKEELDCIDYDDHGNVLPARYNDYWYWD